MNTIEFIDFLAFYKIKEKATLGTRIIDKFKDGTIKIEKLAGSQHLFSFRLNREQRVICTIGHYQQRVGLIVLELLPHHEYDSSKYLNGTAHFDSVEAYEALDIVAQRQDEEVLGGLPVLPKIGSVRLADTVFLLSPKQLAIVDHDEEKPIILVSGAAGTGKTLMAELLLKKQLNANDKVLYVTSSEKLVSKVREDFQENELGVAAIKSFQTLCKDNGFILAESVLREENHFIDWVAHQEDFKEYIRNNALKKSAQTTAKELYEDLRKVQDSNHKNLDQLGKKSLHDHAQYHAQLVTALYHKYIKALKEHNEIDLALADYPEHNPHLYDCIIIDEAQDFGKSSLKYIHSFLQPHGHIYFLIDWHQSLFNSFNLSHQYIQELTHAPDKDIIHYQLINSYRNATQVAKLANDLIALKRKIIGGRLNPLEVLTIESVPGNLDGHIGWVEGASKGFSSRNQSILDSLREQSEQSIEIAFIVPDTSVVRQAKAIFPQGIIFTPETIKGLEFSTIVLLDFLTKKYTQLPIDLLTTLLNAPEDNPDRIYFPKSTEQAYLNRFFNQLFVSITRSKENIYFIHTKPDQVTDLFKKNLEKTIEDAPPIPNAPLPASTLEEICQFIKANYAHLTFDLLMEYGRRACDKAKEGMQKSSLASFLDIKNILNDQIPSATDHHQQKNLAQLIKSIQKIVAPYLPAHRSAIDDLPKHPSTATTPSNKIGSLDNLKTIDLHKISPEQLEEVIRGKTVLCNLLILRQQDLLALFKNHLDQFDAFLKKITSKALNYADEKGISALYSLSCSNTCLEMFNHMVDDKRFMNQISTEGLKKIGPKGYSPFLFVLINNHQIILDELESNKKFDHRMKKLKDQSLLVKYLIEKGAKIPQYFQGGETLIHCAAIEGDLYMIKFLIACGEAGDKPNDQGDTALHFAAGGGHLKVVQFLIKVFQETGLDIEVANHGGATPLHCAVDSDQLEVVKEFVANKVSATKGNDKGATALHIAAANGNKAIAQRLLSLPGVHVDQAMNDGATPLHCAADSGSEVMVQFLIENEARIDSLRNKKDSPLSLAALKGHLPVVQLLTEHGAINEIVKQITDQDYVTALNCAAQNGHLPVIKYLVEKIKGIDACSGRTNAHRFSMYFFTAIKCGQLPAVQWFLEQPHLGLDEPESSTLDLGLDLAKKHKKQPIIDYLTNKQHKLPEAGQLAQMMSATTDGLDNHIYSLSDVVEATSCPTVSSGTEMGCDTPFSDVRTRRSFNL